MIRDQTEVGSPFGCGDVFQSFQTSFNRYAPGYVFPLAFAVVPFAFSVILYPPTHGSSLRSSLSPVFWGRVDGLTLFHISCTARLDAVSPPGGYVVRGSPSMYR